MTTLKLMTTLAAAGLLAAAGCDNNWKVNRVDPMTQTDVDYHFNDQDAREIFQGMTQDMMSRGFAERYMQSHNGRLPIVYLGKVRNNTQDYIGTELFTNQIQDEMLNSGKFEIKLEGDRRGEIRDERLDTKYNDPATIKKVAAEANADLALMGSISDVKQRSNDGHTVVSFYQAHLELVDVESAKKLWSDTKEIKKVARR